MDSNKKELFIKLTESTLSELENQGHLYNYKCVLSIYHRILVYYYQNNVSELELIVIELRSNLNSSNSKIDELVLLFHILKLRLSIRKNQVRKFLIENLLEALEALSLENQSLWSGEVYILIAFALGEINNFSESVKYYELAISFLDALPAKLKSLRAKQNLIATYESLNSKKNLLYKYKCLLKDAAEINAYGTAALALMNIARGFQKLKLFNHALRYIKRASVFINKDPNSLQYYLVHLYKAHILIDINHIDEARGILDICRFSSLSEIQGGIVLLEGILAKKTKSGLSFKKGQRLLFGWLDRINFYHKNISHTEQKKFSDLEEKLILLICFRNPSIQEAAVKIYGESIELEFTVDRIKDLIKRINRKIPAKIVRKDNQLFISA